MPKLLDRHYRILSAAFSVIGDQSVRMLVLVFFKPANRHSIALPRPAQSRLAGVSKSLRSHQQCVAGGVFTHLSRLRRITDRSSHSS
jgi:hypothetical protein